MSFKLIDRSELVAAGLLVALGVFVAAQAWDWPYLTKDGPGPGFFPLWIGLLLAALSIALVALQARDAAAGRAPEKTDWRGTGRVLVGWLAVMAAAALLKPAGFVVSYVLLTAFLIRVVFRQRWTQAAAVSLGSAAAFWLLFVKLLKVRLPAGPWGF
ncbi:MAG TPA: tripartite tricarboxylate transporter TctB family protein [Burkholderiales bacterium]|jgi:putative tricarboxylic transport membrane protein